MHVIIPSLGYSDFLAVTLPAWRALLPAAAIRVVCGDHERLPPIAGTAGVVFLSTDAWGRDGAVFNKAAALDEALQGRVVGDLCLVADADVVPFGALPEALDPDTLYGCARYQCDTPAQLEAYRAGRIGLEAFPLIQPRTASPHPPFTPAAAAAMCVGYFQLFGYSPARRFGSFPTAGGYDMAFRRQFRHWVGLTDFHVLHLGAPDRRNWKGRIVPSWPAGVSA